MRNDLHTPWSDEIGLVAWSSEQNAAGYRLPENPDTRQIFGTWQDGVSRGEFYSSMKAGLQASASVEIWTVDYEGEKFVSFRGRFYRILRTYPSSFDHTVLILEEVVR